MPPGVASVELCPKLLLPSMVISPGVVKLNWPAVLSAFTAVALAFVMFTEPVLPVSVAKLLSALFSEWVPPTPWSDSFAEVSALVCVVVPVLLRVSVPPLVLTGALSAMPPDPALSSTSSTPDDEWIV